jgi:hypothetical protein
MAKRWIGLSDDTGIVHHWRFVCVPPGTLASSSLDTVYLDVGGGFGPGVIDHHQGGTEACSATRLLLRRPDFVFEHLVKGWREAARLRRPKDDPLEVVATVVLHEQPDFDSLAAAHLAMELVNTGGFPDYAPALAAYADRIDQGLERLERDESGEATLYALMLALMNSKSRPKIAEGISDSSDGMIYCARRLFVLWARSAPAGQLPTASTRVRLDFGTAQHQYPPMLKNLPEELEADFKRFRELRSAGRIREIGEVRLPAAGASGATCVVRGSAIPEVEELWTHRFLLRQGDETFKATPLTVIARRLGVVGPASTTDRRKFTVSVDANMREARLVGLGAALEVLESRKRQALGEAHVAERRGVARFPEFPGIEDPWYDGRGHNHTIVESPKCGTVLEYGDIEAVLSESFWEPEVKSGSVAWFDEGKGCTELVGAPVVGRLDAWRRCVAEARSAGAPGGSSLMLVRCEIHPGWGAAPIAAFAESVCGTSPSRYVVEGCACFVGAQGVLVNAPAGRASEKVLRMQMERIATLVQELARIDARLAASDSRRRVDGSASRGLLRTHAESVARFHAGRANDLTAEVLVVVQELERRLGLADRIDGVGRLLEQLHEDSERMLAARLNRIVFFIGLFSVLQTAATIWPDGLTGWQPLGGLGVRLGLMEALFYAFSLVTVLAFVPAFARWLQKLPVLGSTLFDDAVPGRGR